MVEKHATTPSTVAKPVGPYSHAYAIDAGDARIVFVAGQVGVDRSGNLVGKGDMRAQAAQTLENIAEVLAANGAGFADVVKMNTYVTDIDRRAEVSEARAAFLKPPFPISTFVEVSRLIDPDWLIEIECVAVVSAK